MTTTSDSARTGDIQRRVVDWVGAALATATTTDGVGLHAVATRAASLPDDGLEVRPEDWTVQVELRFSAGDRTKAGEVLGTIAEASGAVTLEGGEAAEIEWPDGSEGTAVEQAEGEPTDKPYRGVVAVHVSIPWPSRNDESAESA